MINKKASKIILKIILAVLLAVVLFAIFLFLNGTRFHKAYDADPYLSEWMGDIDDSTLLRKVKIPGSHDAGTSGMLWPFATQNSTITEQLTYGCRYFDIRVNKTDKGYKIYHSFANGADFEPILDSLKAFIVSHPTEVLILDFQHFSGDSRDDVIRMVYDSFNKDGLLVHNTGNVTDAEFISSLTLGEARGKCLVFIGGTTDDTADWIFLRNNDECTRDDTVLDSFYLGDYHKGGFDSLTGNAHPEYFALEDEKEEKGTAGIFVLQCQLTDGYMIFGPASIERGQEKKMDEYVINLRTDSHLGVINVIMRDFLTLEKCTAIIDLNK